jgi:mannose-1-phosphate guanylyltransferase
MQIIIVAGGGGSRLWPLSTAEKPKQFIPLINNTSSLQKIYSYISESFEAEQIWINTNARYSELVLQSLPGFNMSNILAEPEKRDNFAAVAVQAAILAHKFGDFEPLIFTTSDEFFETRVSSTKFTDALRRIGQSLSNNEFEIVTMGVKATSPNINYGYVMLDPSNVSKSFESVVPVENFREKPSPTTAQEYLNSGMYVWNKFNPSFTYATLHRIIQKFHPDLVEIFDSIRQTGQCSLAMYQTIPKISFDYAVMEKASSMGITVLDIDDWIDVGNWEQAYKHLPQESANTLQLSASENKIMTTNPNRKQITFVGVNKLLVVETEASEHWELEK